jgi:hypothetical protein
MIDEEKLKENFIQAREDLMTEEEIKRVDYYLLRHQDGMADLQETLDEWEEIAEMYESERESTYEHDINAFVNIMLPNIEGQVSSLISSNISATCKGKGISDQKFASTADPIISLIMKESKIKERVKRSSRRYITFGECYVMPYWDDEAFDNFGIAKLKTPQIGTVVVDGNVKDMEDVQEAEYIIREIGSKPISWARRKFGDEVADAITLGNQVAKFEDTNTTDDDKAFTMIEVWTRDNENEVLERIQMSLCGILLDVKPKGERMSPTEPFFKYVHNKYPFFFAGLYPREGEFHRFGDGKLLKPIQELINKLYDEIILAIKFSSQGRTFADPQAKVNPDEFAEADPSKLILGKNPNNFIKTVQGTGINEVVFNLLAQLFQKVQEATRFSALMTGNETGEQMTATQAGIQMQQGNTGIDDKRSDLSNMFGEALTYCLGLCMEFWDTGKAVRIADTDQFQWVEAKKLRNVPELIPADTEFKENWKSKNPKAPKDKMPKWMTYSVKNGEDKKLATKQVDLDIEISLGEGLPSNKMALYNIILSLAMIQMPDERTGQAKSLISYEKTRQLIEEILGLQLSDDEVKGMVDKAKQMQKPQAPQGMVNTNQSPNVPGATQNGNMRPNIGGNNSVV